MKKWEIITLTSASVLVITWTIGIVCGMTVHDPILRPKLVELFMGGGGLLAAIPIYLVGIADGIRCLFSKS